MTADTTKVEKSDAEWKKQLTPAEYRVIREKGTERAFTGEYDKFYPKKGYFVCKACNNVGAMVSVKTCRKHILGHAHTHKQTHNY